MFNVLFLRGTTTKLFDNSMDTINVSLKVSKSANKGQYERYEIRKMAKFTMVNDNSFRMGFFSVSRANCDIKSERLRTDETRKQDVKARAFKYLHLFALSKFRAHSFATYAYSRRLCPLEFFIVFELKNN